MRRPQFTLKSLLWSMACVACIFAGIAIGERNERKRLQSVYDEKVGEINRLMAEQTDLLVKTKDEFDKLEDERKALSDK